MTVDTTCQKHNTSGSIPSDLSVRYRHAL